MIHSFTKSDFRKKQTLETFAIKSCPSAMQLMMLMHKIILKSYSRSPPSARLLDFSL